MKNTRTTVILKHELVEEARKATGINEKTALIHLGLKALIRQKSIERLIALGGADKNAKAGKSRRKRIHKK